MAFFDPLNPSKVKWGVSKRGHFGVSRPRGPRIWGSRDPQIRGPRVKRGHLGVILGSFLDPLLGQSGSKRPVVLKKGCTKKGQKGVILGSRDPEDPGSGRSWDPQIRGPRVKRVLFGGLSETLFLTPFGQDRAKLGY
jgi:hypothetical protein